VLLATLTLAAGCAVKSEHDRPYVADELRHRTGLELGEERSPGESSVPEGISLDDGVTEDEAVAVALWNNTAFQADLATLGIARADLLKAGLLRNPVLSVLFASGPKRAELTLAWPIEELWQRPSRVAAARLDAERVADGLVQHGLDLIRDTRVAHADALRLRALADAEQERAALLREIGEIDAARWRAGDVSELQAEASRIEALRATDAAERLRLEAGLARDRLQSLMGLDPMSEPLDPVAPAPRPGAFGELDPLIDIALAARPDLRAAEIKIEALGKRAGLARAEVFRFIGLLDSKETVLGDYETGPGLVWEIPLFNANRDGKVRVQAEMSQAAWQYVTLRDAIVREVRAALDRYRTSERSYREWSRSIVPSIEDNLRRSDAALTSGELSRLDVLGARRQLVEARGRSIEAEAELRMAEAQLVRAIGTDPSRWADSSGAPQEVSAHGDRLTAYPAATAADDEGRLP